MSRDHAIAVAIVSLLVLGACGGPDHEHHQPTTAAGAADAAPVSNRIPIPAGVRSNLGITFATVEFRAVASTRRYPARFEPEADARRDYRAAIAGVVEPLVRPYQRIAAGDPLARIAGRGWAGLQREWLESRTETAQQEDAVGKARATRRALLTAQIAAAAGIAIDDPRLEELAVAPALTIHARSAGLVEPTIAVSGSMVQEGDLLLATLDPTRVRLRASVPQGDLATLRESMPARIVPAADAWRDGIPARLAFGLEADPTLRTQDLIAWPQLGADAVAPPWARAGVTALLEVRLAGGDGELAIPIAATIRDGLDTILFRRDPADPDQVVRLVADLGARDGEWVEILSGVAEGDQVVVDGIYQLRLSGAGKAQLGGHFHSDGTFHPDAEDSGGGGH